MRKILIIDDDVTIGDLEQEVLEREGYAVQRAYSGTEALLLLKDSRPDLVLLDLMLPGLPGEEVLPQLKGIPVIVVSAKASVEDKVDLLLGGAADYLTKPFALEELAARVQAHLRRQERSAPGRPAGGPIQIGAIRLDPEKLTVTKAGAPVALSTRELELLTYLMRHAGETLSRDRIFHDVWRTDYGDVGTVAINIKNLRSKLDPEWRYIKTVWGSGYRFVTQSGFAEEEAEKG